MKAISWLTGAAFTAAAVPLLAIGGLAAITAGGLATSNLGAEPGGASADALKDIPPVLLPLFQREAAECVGLPWTVLAAVSRVESNHGRYGGAQIQPDGQVTPPIIGIALNGTGGTARIIDSDGGRWDRDTIWDRAVGPFQFIPSSWRIFGGDGNRDGIADPHNIRDALPAMRRHLCPEGRVTDLNAAIYAYNNSDAYVAEVLDWARRYAAPPATAVVGGNALPLPPGTFGEAQLVQPHHDYPAWDAAVPVGTPVLAMTRGTVVTASEAGVYPGDPNRCGTTVAIAGDDGAHYVYCHLSRLNVEAGQHVDAGTQLGLTGGQPGAPGAGNTTGPHLHLSVRVDGVSVCPQPLLLAVARNRAIAPLVAPSSGCVSDAPRTDWASWLNRLGEVASSS